MKKDLPINYQHRHVEEGSPWVLLFIPVAIAVAMFYLFFVIPKTLDPTFVRTDKVQCSALVKPVKGCHR